MLSFQGMHFQYGYLKILENLKEEKQENYHVIAIRMLTLPNN